MSHRARVAFVGALLFVLGVAPGPVTAQQRPAQLRDAVAGMLKDGWAVGGGALANAAEHYEQAEALAPGDARTGYGWILVLLKHRKYTDALARIDKILARNPRHQTALQWSVRIKMLRGDYAAALADLQALARALPEVRDSQARADQVRMAEFMGRMVGFAEGPAEVAESLRDGVMRELESKLGDIERQAFERARAGVVGQHAAFLQERDQVVTDAVAQAERERQAQLAAIDSQREQMVAEQRQIDSTRSQIRSDERQELADVSRAVRVAGGELARSRERLSAVVREIDFARISFNQLLLARDAQEDEGQRALLQLELIRVQRRIAELDRLARSRQLEFARHQQRLVALENQRAEVVNRYRGELNNLTEREASLAKQEKRMLAIERKLGRTPSGRSSKGGNLATRAGAFTTYEPFPLDSERQRVLSTFD